jgi:hypothetical protein
MRPADPSYAYLLAVRLPESGEMNGATAAVPRELVERATNTRPSYRAGVVLHDAAENTLLVVSLWDDAAGADGAGIAPLPAGSELLPQSGRYDVAQFAGMPGGTAARVFLAELRNEPGIIDQSVAQFQNVVLHAATRQAGFRRGILLVDRSRSFAVSIGVWTSRDHLLAGEAGDEGSYLAAQLARFADLLAAPPLRLTPDVLRED